MPITQLMILIFGFRNLLVLPLKEVTSLNKNPTHLILKRFFTNGFMDRIFLR